MKLWMKQHRGGASVAIVTFWLGVIGLSLALSGQFFSNPLLALRQALGLDGLVVHTAVGERSVSAGQSAIATRDGSNHEHGDGHHADDDPMTTRDATGWVRTISHDVGQDGTVDTNNAFFKSLGTNGRSCASCHVQSAAWSITPPELQARFAATGGTDPIFRLNDGANSPNANVATVSARRNAYSMLLRRGLIRVGIGIPATAEFTLADVQDPYGYASASELSLFRRVLPSTNLNFLTGLMWDGQDRKSTRLNSSHW